MGNRAKPGDIFSWDLPKGTQVFGQILLDVRTQCIEARLLPAGSTLAFFADTFLQRIMRGTEPGGSSLLPPLLTWEDDWTMKGHADVVLEEVDFPQGLLARGPSPGFLWGELWLPIGLSHEEMRKINAAPVIRDGESVVNMALHALGRVDELDPKHKKPEIFAASQLDLRASPHKDRVHSLLGDRIGSSYFETALRYGYDVRRFYGKALQERALVLCPFCQAPFDDALGRCPNCERNTRDDAPSEMTAQELAEWERVRCRACETPILSVALVCPGCKEPQRG